MRAVSRRVMLAGVAAALLVGCGGKKKTSGAEPPAIQYGRHVCARCGMIISDERQAAGLVDEDGEAVVFDDAGEMVSSVQDDGVAGRRIWVHDYAGSGWVDGTTASFVAGPPAKTPMATGVVAFRERAAADGYAEEFGGGVMSWDEIRENWRIGTPAPLE